MKRRFSAFSGVTTFPNSIISIGQEELLSFGTKIANDLSLVHCSLLGNTKISFGFIFLSVSLLPSSEKLLPSAVSTQS